MDRVTHRQLNEVRDTGDTLSKSTGKVSQKLVEELARSNAELEQFAYVASHDLQEPLRMVSSYAALLKEEYRGALSSEADEYIDMIVDGAHRMRSLIEGLLEYSRVGKNPKPFEYVDCNALVNHVLQDLTLSIEESNAMVDVGPLPSVKGIPILLSQLFRNLISNSIKFRSDKSPHVTVRAEKKDGEWVFSIADKGVGFDMQYAGHVFQIFSRLHSRKRFPGNGLGLAICKKIVTLHGGRIWVESYPNQGTSFYFTLEEPHETNHSTSSNPD